MSKYMKLVAFVVLGLVVSAAIFGIIVEILDWHRDSDFLPCVFIAMPISLLAGSAITGFLSCSNLENKWGLFGIPPGLYITLPFMCMAPMDISIFLLIFLCWYLSSLIGILLGYFLRSLTRRA